MMQQIPDTSVTGTPKFGNGGAVGKPTGLNYSGITMTASTIVVTAIDATATAFVRGSDRRG